MILGTITTVDDNNGLCLIVDGEDSATTKKYSYLSSYVPTANDRVLIEEIGGSYVILGKIITEYTSSGIVRQAENATNAENAVNSTNSINATNAENATNAVRAETAASATTANTATYADNLNGTHTQNINQVTYVNRQYDASIGWYVADVSTNSVAVIAI